MVAEWIKNLTEIQNKDWLDSFPKVEVEEHWINKPKIQKAIKFLRENPSMKNCDVAKLCDLHYHSVRKVRKLVGIEKMEQKQGEEYVKGLKEQPIVSAFELTELMGD